MYQFFLWLHIVSIISWMAGVLYLFRLFIYHKEKGENSQQIHELLSLMELRLYKYITVPAMAVAIVAGFSMLFLVPTHFQNGWIWAKLIFVAGLIISTVYGGNIMRKFARLDTNGFSSKQLRYLNEVPTVLMLIIVAFVIFKPF